MSQKRGLLRSAGAVSVATLVSRVLGLAREMVQAYFFGAGMAVDAFNAAFRIPNLLRDLFAEGALSSAFVPTFTAERERAGLPAAWRLANRVTTLLTLALGALAVLVAVAAPAILRVYVPGFAPEKMALAVTMTRILSGFLVFVALAAVAMGMLNTCGRFFVPALAPAWFNVATIAGMVVLVPLLRALGLPAIHSLAIGAMGGGVLQFAVQVPALRREGFRFRPEIAPRDPGVRRVTRLMLPATFGLAATQVNILVDTILASSFGDGPIAWLQYAFRLILLPIGLFGVALATANLARVSRDAARNDTEGMRANVVSAMRAVALLTLPASAGLVVLREPIVKVLFEHGHFGPEDTARTAGALLFYALGLYAYSATKILVPTYYALGDTRWPVVASAVSVALKIGANFAWIALLPKLGFEAFLGLALSTSIAAWVNFGLLEWGLRRRIGSGREYPVLRATVASAAIAVGMGIVCALAHSGLLRFFPGGGAVGDVLRLLGTVALGVAIAMGGSLAIGIGEARQLAARLLRVASTRGNP